MNKSLYEFKEKLLAAGFLRHQSGQEYTCQCPFCNDNKRHCYVLIKLNDDTPVLYNCFKCNSSGVVNTKFLEYFGIDDINIPKYAASKKLDVNSTATVKSMGVIVDEHDDIKSVQEYLKWKIGETPTLEELQIFQYVGKPFKYAKEYLGFDGNRNVFMNRNWFRLSNGNIIGRWNNDDNPYRWHKLKSNKVKGVGLYTLKLPFDLYQNITVYIAEGIVDIIGLYYHYREDDNCIYVAVMGKDYEKGIKHVLNKGIFGSSVSVKIFKDPDVDVNKIRIDPVLKKLFRRIDVYGNLMDKDYGVTQDNLDIHKIKTL